MPQAWLTWRFRLEAGVGFGYHISNSDYVRGGTADATGPRPAAVQTGAPLDDDRAPRATPAYFTAIG